MTKVKMTRPRNLRLIPEKRKTGPARERYTVSPLSLGQCNVLPGEREGRSEKKKKKETRQIGAASDKLMHVRRSPLVRHILSLSE